MFLAKVDFFYSVILMVLGILAYFVWSDRASITALIPAFFGFAMFTLCILYSCHAISKSAFVVISVLNVVLMLGCLPGVMKLKVLLSGGELLRPMAVKVQIITFLLATIYLIIKSLTLYFTRKSIGS